MKTNARIVAGLSIALARAFLAAVVGGCSGGGAAPVSDGAIDLALADLAHPAGAAGGPVSGAADSHCKGVVQRTSAAECHVRPDLAGNGQGPQYGATLFNSAGDDDACKYHVSFTVSPVYENFAAAFTVVATSLTDGTPAVGAGVLAEVYLSDTHPAPNTPQTTTEGPPGTYRIGPVQFDAAGRWTVRFHLHDECSAILDSPQGNVAFFIDVP